MATPTRYDPISSLLQSHELLIVDGAMATELERMGCDLADPLWSAKTLIEAPELIKEVHGAYFRAGADIAITATYQATFEGFARRGIDFERAEELMRLAVRLAAEARDEFWSAPGNRAGRVRPLVAASIGPYGAYLADGSEYRGEYGLGVEELMMFHRPRMAVLAETEADLFACETVPCEVEALALARLLCEFPTRTGWISFSCRDGAHTNHGELLEECVRALEPFDGVSAVGVNCTAPEYIVDLVRAARSATRKPIVVYPNSGERYVAEEHAWSGDRGNATLALDAGKWHAAGAALIGGCCRTGPDDIEALARQIPAHEFHV
jgi:homocysteine S-methyltransferase